MTTARITRIAIRFVAGVVAVGLVASAQARQPDGAEPPAGAEIYLLAGQSNMSGRGDFSALTPAGATVRGAWLQFDAASIVANVPPMSGEFPMYGGLYRPVSLVLTDRAHIAMRDWGGPGVYARTLNVEGKTASIALETRLENDRRTRTAMSIEASILDRDGDSITAASGAPLDALGEPK